MAPQRIPHAGKGALLCHPQRSIAFGFMPENGSAVGTINKWPTTY
jgi:hypothetical protein